MKHFFQSTPLRHAAVLSCFAVLIAQLGSGTAHAASVVYNISTTITSGALTGNPLQTDSVVGTITTDGTIGVLAASDILSWNLNLVDQLTPANDSTLTNSNSSLVEDSGGALSANATQLLFDFSGSGEFLIQGTAHGAYSGWDYFCFSTGGACAAGETISPQYVFVDGVVLTGASTPVGQQPLGPAPSTSVPEPANGLLILTGIVGLATRLKWNRS